MRTLYRILTLIVAALVCHTSYSTHLVGGSMSYRYITKLANGSIVYQFRLDLYRDGSKDENAKFDPEILLGIHLNDAGLNLFRVKRVEISSQYFVNPVSNTTCPNTLTYKVEYGLYQDTLILPPSTVGYHLTFVRCCRNTQTNLPNAPGGQPYQGQTYYCKIPPTNIKNSSPYFSLLPIPMICSGDTTNVLLTASDPDKDSLVYSFVTPFAGGSSSGSSGAMPDPPDQLTLPLASVQYNSGYSGSYPFGTAGYTAISSANGLTTMYAPNPGRYAIAIRVDEYRNGVMISSVYLDLQYFVIDCPPNIKPYLTASSQPFYREVNAGEQLCFDITGSDYDSKDSVFIEGFGDIFTGANSFDPPLATFPSKTSKTTISSRFCWTPSCEQGQEQPYVFAVRVRDNGCLPKFETYNFTIKVKPFKPGSIVGLNNVCQNEVAIYRAAAPGPGSSLQWSVTGGVLQSGQGSTSIYVLWDAPGTGEVSMVETSKFGCVAPAVKLPVNISPLPAKPDIGDQLYVCQYSTNNYYIKNPSSTLGYRWFVEGGNISGSNSGTSVTINWGAKGQGRVRAVSRAINGSGCTSDTTDFPVGILFPEITNFKGTQSVCPHSRNIEYSADSVPGSTYVWIVTGGVQKSGGNKHKITVDWGAEGTGKIKVFQVNQYGCFSDTFFVDVHIGYVLEGMVPVGDSTVCEHSVKVPYQVDHTNGSTYTWDVTGGTIVSGNGTHRILVDWGSAAGSPGVVSVVETSYDSVNKRPCIGKLKTLNVNIYPLPLADKVNGTMELCQSTGNYTYTLNGFAGSVYQWEITGPAPMSFTGQGTSTITINWDKEGTFTIKVTEHSQYGCIGTPVDTQVVIHPKPRTTPITGDSIVCFPHYSDNHYAVTGFANSTYAWTIDGGTPVENSVTNSIYINWSGKRYSSINVVETSEYGCVGDPVKRPVITDNPQLVMRYVSVGDPDDRMEIKWQLVDGELYNSTFIIEKRKTGSGDNWKTVKEVKKDTQFYIEKPLNTDIATYDYRVRGKNLCGEDIYTGIHTAVLLQGKQNEPYHVDINFSNYRGWPGGVSYYELYRKLPGKNDYVLYKVFTGDSAAHFNNGLDNYTQCYRIKSYELGGKEEISWSNEICFDFEPLIWVPNAFTPNDDNKNQIFKIVTAALKTYQIDIYNRWGEKIYTSNNPEESWDGTYKGQDCAQGVYVFNIMYSGHDNRVKLIKGDVTLIR